MAAPPPKGSFANETIQLNIPIWSDRFFAWMIDFNKLQATFPFWLDIYPYRIFRTVKTVLYYTDLGIFLLTGPI